MGAEPKVSNVRPAYLTTVSKEMGLETTVVPTGSVACCTP